MIPILQTNRNHLTGDCLSACLASILEINPKIVPKFLEAGRKDFWDNFNLWCKTILGEQLSGWRGYRNVPGYSILCYNTEQDPHTNIPIGHAIVAKDGEPFHCPSHGKPPKCWWLRPSRVYLTFIVPEGLPKEHFARLI